MVNNHEMSAQFGEWVIAKDHLPSIAYVVLSAFAAVVSYLIARLFHLPEAYLAPMSTLIVMKLTLSRHFPLPSSMLWERRLAQLLERGRTSTFTKASGHLEWLLPSSDCCASHFASPEARFDMPVSPL